MAKNKLPEILTDKVTHLSQDKWIIELTLPDYELGGFFQHFQFLFGGMSKSKGIHLSQREISEHMGKSTRYVKYKLAELVELGILSYARKSSHPRAGGVYFININKPGEFDDKAQACILTDTRVKPVVVQAEEVIDQAIEQSASFAAQCMAVAVEAGTSFINPSDGIQVRDFVYQGLLSEAISVAQAINAVRILKTGNHPCTRSNWDWAATRELNLSDEQKRAAMLKQQELAGAE